MTTVIDAVANLFTPEVVDTRPDWSAAHMNRRFSVDATELKGVSMEEELRQMDEAGVDMAILVVQRMGQWGTPGFWAMSPEFVVDAIEQHPQRFAGQLGVDPTSGSNGLRELRVLVEDYGFVGAHLYPHWFDIDPADRIVFPFYEACAELGIPIQIQVGQSLVYSPERPLRSVGQPMSLEPVAIQFPELNLIGSHLGYPWVDEMIALSSVYENVYLCTDSYAPRYWPDSLNHYVRGEGAKKVMFGTMWPTIPFDRAIREIADKALPENVRTRVLGETAASLYGIPARRGVQ